MISHSWMRTCMTAVLVLLCGFTATPVLSEQGLVVEPIPAEPGVTEVIGRILEDPHRDYSRVHGPDDCSSEALYLSTKKQLQDYVANPAQQSAALRDYLTSGEGPCNCTRAIVGKYLDVLVKDVGLSMSGLSCL